MGVSGTQIAMNASDIVLLDDNFASIVFSSFGQLLANAAPVNANNIATATSNVFINSFF